MNEIPEKIALRGLMTGEIAGRDISNHVESVLNRFKSSVMDQVATMGDLHLFDGVIFSGGGANLMNADFIDVLKTSNPQFDNALGALSILESI